MPEAAYLNKPEVVKVGMAEQGIIQEQAIRNLSAEKQAEPENPKEFSKAPAQAIPKLIKPELPKAERITKVAKQRVEHVFIPRHIEVPELITPAPADLSFVYNLEVGAVSAVETEDITMTEEIADIAADTGLAESAREPHGLELPTVELPSWDWQMPETLPFVENLDGEASRVIIPDEEVEREVTNVHIALPERFAMLEPTEQEEVVALIEDISHSVQTVMELRSTPERSEEARLAEQELYEMVSALMQKLDIEPSYENVWFFIEQVTLAATETSLQDENVDEGTHEHKLGIAYLLKQLMQLAKEARLPHMRLGRLVCKQLVPTAA